MNDKARKAGVYAASANWERLAYLAIAAVAAWHYVAPWLATVIVPAVLHHLYQAKVIGFRALTQAAIQEYLKFRGYSQEQAEKWTEQEASEGKPE